MPRRQPSVADPKDTKKQIEEEFAALRYEGEGEELTALQYEASRHRLFEREANQRVVVRWAVVFIGIIVVAFMAYILFYHLFCHPLLSTENEFSWIVIVAPVTSITVITVSLLVAAFRRFDNKDLDKDYSDTIRNNAVSATGNLVGGG